MRTFCTTTHYDSLLFVRIVSIFVCLGVFDSIYPFRGKLVTRLKEMKPESVDIFLRECVCVGGGGEKTSKLEQLVT